MNIKQIIREEVNDFDWIKDEPSFDEVLDNRFRLVPVGDAYKFEDVIEHHGYERNTYTSLVKHGPRALLTVILDSTASYQAHKIVLGKKPKWWRRDDTLKTLKDWKNDRIRGLKKTYPGITPIGSGDTGPR